ncbi:lipoate--protein ligase family protein [Planctomycetaceae bacterium SH139]
MKINNTTASGNKFNATSFPPALHADIYPNRMIPLLHEPSSLDANYRQPSFQLAIDEACLEAAEAGETSELLRVWEFEQPVVVLGRGSKVAGEVDQDHCQRRGIPLLRRCSGGASIVAGPGCLMYSVVLSLRQRAELRNLDLAHDFIMTTLTAAIASRVPEVRFQGTCDLTYRDRKFSGNSLRVAREHILYHGTLLYDADLPLIANCLRMPPRHPDYRQSRDHASFITNLPLPRELLWQTVREAFTREASPALPVEFPASVFRRAETLARERYQNPAWNFRH